jgi:hypothetical protein
VALQDWIRSPKSVRPAEVRQTRIDTHAGARRDQQTVRLTEPRNGPLQFLAFVHPIDSRWIRLLRTLTGLTRFSALRSMLAAVTVRLHRLRKCRDFRGG